LYNIPYDDDEEEEEEEEMVVVGLVNICRVANNKTREQ
jgi:hypothetical protein